MGRRCCAVDTDTLIHTQVLKEKLKMLFAGEMDNPSNERFFVRDAELGLEDQDGNHDNGGGDPSPAAGAGSVPGSGDEAEEAQVLPLWAAISLLY